MNSEYGTYRLTYTPPNDPDPHYPLISIDMSTSGDADVSQMLRFFEAFLAASGYILKGDLQVVERETKPDYDSSLWSITTSGSQATNFIPAADFWGGDCMIFGAQGNHTISFGSK